MLLSSVRRSKCLPLGRVLCRSLVTAEQSRPLGFNDGGKAVDALPIRTVLTRPTADAKSATSASISKDHPFRENPLSRGPGDSFPHDAPSSMTRDAFKAWRQKTASIGEKRTIDKWYTEVHPQWLRDNCGCSSCIDPSTRQRLFQTADIPHDISAKTLEREVDYFRVEWANDVKGYGTEHVSSYSFADLDRHGFAGILDESDRSKHHRQSSDISSWNAQEMSESIQFIEYEDYISDDDTFVSALKQLQRYGLVFLRNAPTKEVTIEKIVERIGHLRHTFYGRTWDVKSVPQAKNVAYTSQFLGFHMDLLYMADPPGFQFLHCLESTCNGGESMFMDSFHAYQCMNTDGDATAKKHLDALTTFQQVFHYDNDGVHYRYARPVIELQDGQIKCVNWSPPFQGTSMENGLVKFPQYVEAAKHFSNIVEDPKNIYEYRMKEGDCVIFNNRRVLHARREFDTTSGKRWLKGAYLSTDEFDSQCRVRTSEHLQKKKDQRRKVQRTG